MAKYEVLHVVRDDGQSTALAFYCAEAPDIAKRLLDGKILGARYEKVADVECGDVPQLAGLELAFQYTNTIDHYWWLNEQVTPTRHATHSGGGCRSTSVGDIIVAPDGTRHLVMPFGFHPL